MSEYQPLSRTELLAARFSTIREHSLSLVEGLSAEDCQVQSMPDASPLKWHLAHTSWFFETFLLANANQAPPAFDPAFKVLFNSYYLGVGERHLRAERGLLSRPTLDKVLEYRRHVDLHMLERLNTERFEDAALDLIELGLQHEQQHQELMLTDLKHHFSCNPLLPAWRGSSADQRARAGDDQQPAFQPCPGGLVEIGHPEQGFCFDNERPRHQVWLEPFELATRNVSNGEYLAFMLDGGYRRPELWLSEAWDHISTAQWQAPLYWQHDDQDWHVFTLHGRQPLDPRAPVSHISFYEAEAYSRWASAELPGARLPTEAEWEAAAVSTDLPGLHGEVWQWTNSAYLGYPGFKPAAGAVGEYNGKFMLNQMVLRGSSLATPPGHARNSYRNFFPADARWQFSGLRLAR